MKIVAISDLHGNLPEIKEAEFEVLCICGDIIPLEIQGDIPESKKWIINKFNPWCAKLPCKIVLLIAGNHDWVFERTMINEVKNLFLGTKIHYLENDSYEYNGINFYGTPYCHMFGMWAFMRWDDHLEKIFDLIPENVDVLLTHDAPYGTSDICLQNCDWFNGEHIGCVPLRDAVIKKRPKILLHGHLHSTNHNVELLRDTEVYNVSLLDENYNMVYSPLILEV